MRKKLTSETIQVVKYAIGEDGSSMNSWERDQTITAGGSLEMVVKRKGIPGNLSLV